MPTCVTECFGHQTLLPGEFLKQLRQQAGVQVGSLNVHARVVRGPWGLPAGKDEADEALFFLEEERKRPGRSMLWPGAGSSVYLLMRSERKRSLALQLCAVVGCPPSDLPSFSFIVLQT